MSENGEVKPGKLTTEFLLAIVAGTILALIIIGAVVLRALDRITTEQLVTILTGGPPVALALVSGFYALARGLAKRTLVLLPLALGLVLIGGGCGLDWGKLISEAGVVLQAGAQVGQGVSATIGVSCKLVQRYGSAEDYQRCLAVEAAAKTASGLAGAGAAMLPTAKPAATVNVGLPQPIQVTTVVPLEMVQRACPVQTTGRKPIGFTTPGGATDSKPVEVK